MLKNTKYKAHQYSVGLYVGETNAEFTQYEYYRGDFLVFEAGTALILRHNCVYMTNKDAWDFEQ